MQRSFSVWALMSCGIRALALLLGLAIVPGCGQGAEQRPKPKEPRAPAYGDETIMGRLLNERADAPKSAWETIAGTPRVPSLPASWVEAKNKFWLIDGSTGSAFDPATNTWQEIWKELPFTAGSGLALLHDKAERIYVVPGGGSKEFYRLKVGGGEVVKLASLDKAIDRGACLAWSEGKVYLCRGSDSRDFYRYDPAKNSWESLPKVASKFSVAPAGRFTSGLTALGPFVFAWPDHHIQRFDTNTGEWYHRTFHAMGFRPSWNGGSVTADAARGLIFAVQGIYSRTIGVIQPQDKRAKSEFLRPRLPYPMIGEGHRVALATVNGGPYLFVYTIEPDNKICRIPLPALKPIRGDDLVADVGSIWKRVDTRGGGSSVRRRGPKDRSAVSAAMGQVGPHLFLMRLGQVRRIDPERGLYTAYPGFNIGHRIGAGCAAVWDENKHLYFLAGGCQHWVRWEVPKTPIDTVFRGRRPLGETDMEVLPKTPEKVSRGAALTWARGAAYVLRGDETRTVWRFDPQSKKWQDLPPLPAEASLPGATASGLIGTKDALFAFPGTDVWRFDLDQNTWSKFAETSFAPSWDGGMVTLGPENKWAYLVRGEISTRLGRLDLSSGKYEELGPRFPDVVSAEGNRVAIIDRGGVPTIYVHRGHSSTEIWYAPLSALKKM